MQKLTRNIIIATVSVGVATGLFFIIRGSVRKKKALLEEERLNQIRESENQSLNEQLNNQQSGEATVNTPNGGSKTQVYPVRNYNGELINKYYEVMGRTLYPAVKSTNPVEGHKNALGYTNLRTSPEVNNRSEWYDSKTNYLGKITTGKKIGIIVSEAYDNFDPKMRWFKVKLFTPLDIPEFSTSFVSLVSSWLKEPEKYAWVRADNVTFRPYEKKQNTKSSFDGSNSEDCNCE